MANSMLTSFRGYVLASFLLTTGVIGHAVYMKRFFYRSVIFLAYSKLAILAVGNMALVSVLLLWRLIQAIFLGPLRFREVERLHIRARDAIIECCFAMSIFRNEFDLKFVALVMTLLLLKSLHWLVKDRIEFLEEQPTSPVRTHLRLVGLMGLLMAVDIILVKRFASITMNANGATMFVLFAFEFTVSIIELLCDIIRYVFLVIDTSMEGRWEGKAMFSFYIELLSDLCQLTAYILFSVYVQILHSTFPLHILREAYVTFKRFQRRCSDFWRYRRVVATMNDLFADATEEELDEGDRTCIICREEMQMAKKLECGHIFHARCLQSWLKRQLSCPTCRATIDVNSPARRPNNEQNDEQNNPAANNQRQQNQPNNNNAVPPVNNQAGVNFGGAGVRLLNLANQWWNQVMIEAGAAGGGVAPGAVAGAGGQGNGAGVDVGAGQGAGNVPGAVGGVGAAPNNRGIPPQDASRQMPQQNMGIQGNAYLRGPNALAHLQLRARRRVAWPHPYQQYQIQPHMHHHHHHHHPQQFNPYQQPDVQAPMPSHANGPQGNPPSEQQTSAPPPPNNPTQVAGQQSNLAQSTTEAANLSSPASASASGSSNIQTARTGQGESTTPESAQRGQAVRMTYRANVPAPRYTTHHDTGIVESAGDTPGTGSAAQGSQQPFLFTAPSIPLERLFAIQEHIEILRSEVMELVLLATAGPVEMAEVPSVNAENSNRSRMENTAAAEITERSQVNTGNTGAEREVTATDAARGEATEIGSADGTTAASEATVDEAAASNAVQGEATSSDLAAAAAQAQGGDADDAEAAGLRRLRLEFLERVAGN